MRAILILHPFGAALSLQSIKAVVLETRERLDAQARAKIDLFWPRNLKKLCRFCCGPARYFASSFLASLCFVLPLKKNRQGLGTNRHKTGEHGVEL